MDIKIIINLAICVTQLLLMMLPGAILRKTNLVSENFGRDISNMILYVAQPMLVLTAYIRPYDVSIAKRAGMVLILAILAHLLFALLSLLFFRRTEASKRTVLRFALIFSNAGYMGIPLIRYTLGEEAVIYASVYVVVFNLFMWTLGFFMYSGNRQYISIKNALFNTTTIATYIGLLIFFFNLYGFFPADGLIYECFVMLQDLVAPLSMFIIGFRLIDAFKAKHTLDFNLFACIGLRLLLAPAAVFVLLFLFYKTGICTDLMSISVVLISASTPAAAATSMLAEKFKGNGIYASMLVSLCTILSLVTMPLIALLLYLF
ncbi:MAG: AEC family transporter [Clostridia bacterium]|nr:AEC family transporter [Clostridia bacterium]